MSIRARLDDARVLYREGRKEGALLCVLVAVAATSRLRYPKSKYTDRDAFCKFVGDEMRVITGGVVQNFHVNYRCRIMPLQCLLYEFVRCELAHEGGLPPDIVFSAERQLRVEVTDERVCFSQGLVYGLFECVVRAAENAQVFAAERTERGMPPAPMGP